MKNSLLLTCCFFLSGIAQAQVSHGNTAFGVTYTSPVSSCWSRLNWRQPSGSVDLKKVSLEYTIITEAADINSDRSIFVALSSSTEGLWLLRSPAIWRQYSLGQYVDAVAAPLAQADPFLRLEIFRDDDLSGLPANAQLYVGYGIVPNGGTNSAAFQEMLDSKRFELIWSKSNGFKPGPGLFCVSVTTVAETSFLTYPAGTQ